MSALPAQVLDALCAWHAMRIRADHGGNHSVVIAVSMRKEGRIVKDIQDQELDLFADPAQTNNQDLLPPPGCGPSPGNGIQCYSCWFCF
jgi:hypothetical protein